MTKQERGQRGMRLIDDAAFVRDVFIPAALENER